MRISGVVSSLELSRSENVERTTREDRSESVETTSLQLAESDETASLLLVDLYDVVVFHFQGLGRIVVVNPLSIEQKPQRRYGNALTLAVARRREEE